MRQSTTTEWIGTSDFSTMPRPVGWPRLPDRSASFFAEDAHAPLVSEGLVRKVVVKIAR